MDKKQYSIKERLDMFVEMCRLAKNLSFIDGDGVHFILTDLTERKMQIHEGVKTAASAVGAEINTYQDCDNDMEYQWRSEFTYKGVRFFQIGRTREESLNKYGTAK